MKKHEPIIGFEGFYSINKLGEIFSLFSKKFLKVGVGTSGYNYVTLCKNGIRKKFDIHRLVAKQYLPNPDGKLYVNHKNGIKADNSVGNLEWCTHSENMEHAVRTGLTPPPPSMSGKFGKDHNRSKTIYEFNAEGKLLNTYGSGLEFQRRTGKNHSGPNWSMKHKKPIFGLYYSREPHFELTHWRQLK